MTNAPITATGRPGLELTIRGVILGVLITVLFTAANVYLGLKVGLTFASSIPAAVISMAVLRWFKGVTIQENNIVQTVASSAGALSSIIFVLPGLVMVGWWKGFPFWMSFGICAIGGVLGVMYSIPLRRALVTQSTLPYPEGVAAAEVLKVGSGTLEGAVEGAKGLWVIIVGSIGAAAFAAVVATKAFAGELGAYFRFSDGSATGLGLQLSLALIGAGHLMGIAVGFAMLVGVGITWGAFVPILTHLHPAAGAAAVVADNIWHTKVRFIGAGAIASAAIWTLIKLVAPVWTGLMSAMAASRVRSAGEGASLPRTEQDMPIALVGLISLLSLLPMAWLTYSFLQGSALSGQMVPLIVAALVYVVIAGFMVSAVCGYMAGLIGSSNSPVSGMAILAVVGAALLLAAVAKFEHWPASDSQALVAFALFITSVLLAVAVIANDNLQDLKTGQLVDATPWAQQVGLIFGVLAGAIVIPPILYLLNSAYGFAGGVNAMGSSAHVLPAPQATLISTLAKGVINGNAPWSLIGIGILVGLAVVVVDELLRKFTRFSMPPLAVGIAIYLPSALILTSVLGAMIGWIYDNVVKGSPSGEVARRMGVLLASGFIVGEGLFSVLQAIPILITRNGDILAVFGKGFANTGMVLGATVFGLTVVGLYTWTRGMARGVGAAAES